MGQIRGGGRASVRRRAEALHAALELDGRRNTLGVQLSRGTQRLAGFLMACIWPAPLVILDEPANDVAIAWWRYDTRLTRPVQREDGYNDREVPNRPVLPIRLPSGAPVRL
jgi:ABC-type Na+ transport system ATPase subunit NatA